MNILKMTHLSIAAIALASLSACQDQAGDAGADDGELSSAGLKGVSFDWGDNANCAPTGCAPNNPSGGERQNRGPEQGSKIKFAPKFLNLVFLNMGQNGDVSSAFAFYPFDKCEEVEGANAHEIILNAYETSSPQTWPTNGECAPISTGENFEDWVFVGQAKIYMDIEGLESKFNTKHPVVFTQFGSDRTIPKNRNYSFYNAQVIANGAQQGDNLLAMDNYFADLSPNGNWRRLRNNNTNGGWNTLREYSMNLYFSAGTAQVPLVFDPDTGNGSDD